MGNNIVGCQLEGKLLEEFIKQYNEAIMNNNNTFKKKSVSIFLRKLIKIGLIVNKHSKLNETKILRMLEVGSIILKEKPNVNDKELKEVIEDL